MAYIDKIIIKLRNKAEWEIIKSKMDLSDGRTIYGKSYSFEERSFFDNQFSMQCPTEFKDMPESIASRKYISQQRPPVILTSSSFEVDITFNLIKDSIQRHEVAAYRQELQKTIRSVYPANQFYDTGEIEKANLPIEFFEFKSFALGGSLYNNMFITSIHGRGLMGTFNCPFDQFPEWRDAVFLMIGSLAEL